MTELRLDGVTFDYPGGVRALDGVDLVIEPGTSLGLVGANGSGKTTLARLLVGLLRPTLGRILVDGTDARRFSVAQLAGSVGLCFGQPDRQIFERRVRAEVRVGPRNLGRTEAVQARAVDAALEATGLADAAELHPAELGAARRKLLTIASVLAMDTPVIVLDEPTTGLDEHGVRRVERIVAELSGEGRSVIVISHDLRFVAEVTARIVVLEAGRVALDGTSAQAFEERAWPLLERAGLEPPAAARMGAALGLGSTPTEAALLRALREAGAREPPQPPPPRHPAAT